jgi:hypothetical protein
LLLFSIFFPEVPKVKIRHYFHLHNAKLILMRTNLSPMAETVASVSELRYPFRAKAATLQQKQQQLNKYRFHDVALLGNLGSYTAWR